MKWNSGDELVLLRANLTGCGIFAIGLLVVFYVDVRLVVATW